MILLFGLLDFIRVVTLRMVLSALVALARNIRWISA